MKRPIKLLERCNGDFSFDADGGDVWDEREIENLKLGVVFREKEFRRGDSVRSNLVPWQIKTLEQIRGGDFVVPEKLSVGSRGNG